MTTKTARPLVERQRDAYRELAEALDVLLGIYRAGPIAGSRGHLRAVDRVTKAREKLADLDTEEMCS